MMDKMISANALKKKIYEHPTRRSITKDKVIQYINELPNQVRHGHWIDMGDFEQCSVCTGTHLIEIETVYGKVTRIKSHYCGWCGAKMDEVSE